RTERDEDFGKAAASIFSGAILHLALDSLIEVEASGGIEFLWPLTSAGFSISLIELGDWRPAVVVATACVAVALLKRRRGRS
ncbi:MAG: hypothetical protein JTT11_04130, partial [Candidatus Brockarchaeota archaeon]|nr:hypothetical protein [Candidatus Brockarchaeota archaeon]